MRQLGTLPSAASARRLADYLLTLKIDTRLLPEEGGWGVWVCDEDRLPQARQEWDEFQRNPFDSRFTSAAGAAEMLRQKERRLEAEHQRRTERLQRRMARLGDNRRPLTAVLIAVSVVATLASNMGSSSSPVTRALTIAPYKIENRDDKTWIEWHDLDDLQHGQVWRLVTPIFLHFSIFHILFDMVLFYRLGGEVEARRGPWRLLALVLAIAVPSNLAQYWLGDLRWDGSSLAAHPSSPLFGGMSGVVYGLLGYAWMKVRFDPDLGVYVQPSTVLWLMIWFFLCVSRRFQEFVGPIANMAHGAGLVSGLVYGALPPLACRLWHSLRGD